MTATQSPLQVAVVGCGGRSRSSHLPLLSEFADVQVVGSSASDGAMVATLRVSRADVAALIEAESSGSLRLAGRPA